MALNCRFNDNILLLLVKILPIAEVLSDKFESLPGIGLLTICLTCFKGHAY